jgi:cold shock CspA family protein
MRFEGKLVRWEDAKGFGFIESSQGGEPIFVHVKSFEAAGRRPALGDAVSFEVELGPHNQNRLRMARSTSSASNWWAYGVGCT